MAWSKRFDDPIPLPDGGSIETLRDAAAYIEQLPPSERQHPAVQVAIHVLLQAADYNGPMIFARMGVAKMVGRYAPPKPIRPVKRRRR